MKIEFDPPRIENDYYDFKSNIKKYGKQFAECLERLLNDLICAENAYEIMVRIKYKMHILHGNLRGVYSISPDNKKSKWRVLIICVDEDGKEVAPKDNEKEFLKEITTIRVRKIGDYHD